jgi:hypothetical protein
VVGEPTGAPAVDGEVCGDVGVDDEAPGTGGVAWGSSNRRRRSAGTGGLRRQIGAALVKIWLANWSRRGKDGRRSDGCEGMGRGSALFIEGRRCCGGVLGSLMARQF